MIVFFNSLLIIIFYVHLGVVVYPFCIPIIIINQIFIHLHMCFQAIAFLILVIVLLTSYFNAFISLVMSVLMNMFFLLTDLNRLHNPPLTLHPTLLFYLISSSPRCFTLIYLPPLSLSTSMPLPLIHLFLLTRNNPTIPLIHHHMHVYLTIILQVQIQVWPPLLYSVLDLLLLVLSIVLLLFPHCLSVMPLLRALPLFLLMG